MVKSQLKVFARLKPSTKSVRCDIQAAGKNTSIRLFKKHGGFPLQSQQFSFNKVLDSTSSQAEVFQAVGKPVAMSCLAGFNGTIFAYGQTGSGKTFTMSGTQKWQNRGLVPRVLQLLFNQFQAKKQDIQYRMFISYLQIYNQNAFDLLDKTNVNKGIQNWAKIQFFQDEEGSYTIKGMSTHSCRDTNEGVQLMMTGNFIRQISSTPMNPSSSRSHCVFTINIEGRQLSTDLCINSKLHMVDLAGSQRVSKTNVEGNLLNQAKHINLSLSYLEQVILALNEKKRNGGRAHIPYRNSLLTTLLRDSLGGNCQTVMIATVSLQNQNIEQTVSTLRFSQRVGQLENDIEKNQKYSVNKSQLNRIDQLLRQNQMLKAKLERQEQSCDFMPRLTESALRTQCQRYLSQQLEELPMKNVQQAKYYMNLIRKIYQRKMQEFVGELTKISTILLKYDNQGTREINLETQSERKIRPRPIR